jgi:hypothetical protein
MNKIATCLISGLVFVSLFLLCNRSYCQSDFKLTVEKIAAEEKQNFIERSAKKFTNTDGYRTIAASGNFDVNYYRCEWEIDPAIRFIKGKVTSYFTITSSTDNIIYDLSDTLTVDSITYHGNQLLYRRMGNDALQLQFPFVLSLGNVDSVSIYYQGVPRLSLGIHSFTQALHNGAPIIWTLSEPYGAKEWWPCKNELDDKADSIDVMITNPASYQASSNGVLTQEVISNGSKLSVWKHRYPIASYLVAMAVSNYIVIKDSVLIAGKQMSLVDYVYPENEPDFSANLYFLKYELNLFGEKFGDYPFAKEKYGLTEFGLNGGMEHQTNSFVGSAGNSLNSHETGHQWFGDKITCGNWQNIWLNEGFASYCQVLYFEDADKAFYIQTLVALIKSITSLPNGSVWVDDTTNSSRIFDTRLSYYKGCYLLHMLRGELGDSVFFSGIRRYLNDPLLKYNFAKTEDLQRNLEQESGKSLSSFFQNWFYRQGYPIYSVQWTQDSSNNAYLKIHQTTSDSSVSFFDMPVPVQFKNNNRDTIIVFNNKQNNQAFLANPGFRADTAIFDPEYWLLCHNSITHINCAEVNDSKIFPFYNIQWTQNSNNWTYVDISQTNSAATGEAASIPLYLHFSGNGKDTVIVIKNPGARYYFWLNTGFKATNAFVTTSCLMSTNYALTSQASSTASNEIKIYPVPVTNNLLNISLKNPTDKHFTATLFNAAGQLIYQRKFDTPGKDELFTLPANYLPRGVYIIKLRSETAINLSKKIIN